MAWMVLPMLILIANASSAQDQARGTADAYPDREFTMAMYLWGAGLEGSITGDGVSADVDASFSDILDNLNVGAMFAAGARWGRFVGLFDGMWLALETDETTGSIRVNRVITLGPAEIDAKLSQGMADLKVGYRLIEPEPARPIAFDLLAGARYWYLRNEISADFAVLADRSVDESTDWLDPIVGARVSVALTPALGITLMGDFGGFGVGSASDNTWQLMGLLSYQFSDTWSARVGYRALEIERGLADVQMRGPIAGVVYHF
jgi:opacity protein-like surface antigen